MLASVMNTSTLWLSSTNAQATSALTEVPIRGVLLGPAPSHRASVFHSTVPAPSSNKRSMLRTGNASTANTMGYVLFGALV